MRVRIPLRFPSHTLFVVLLACCSVTCRSRPFMLPDGAACELGPPTAPAVLQEYCSISGSGCPERRPEGTRTLVSVATCDYATGGAPCTTRTEYCPLVDPNGNSAIPFDVGDSRCPSRVSVLLQGKNDGGAGVEWRLQERELRGSSCVDAGPQRIGVANVYGACCATLIDVPLTNTGRTFRMSVQTDWRY